MKSTNGHAPGNRSVDVTNPLNARVANAERPAAQRAKATNHPLRGRISRYTARGRRIGDLFDAYLRAMGNPTDPLAVANALAAAELKVAAEDARVELLNGTDIDHDKLIKLENTARRAERKLGIKPRPPAPAVPMRERLIARDVG